jgi:hypothetical protein
MKLRHFLIIALFVITAGTAQAGPPTFDVDAFVVNDATTPVPVVLPRPVQAETGVIIGGDQATVYTVPDGMRLAIGFLTMAGTLDSNQTRAAITVTTTLDSVQMTHPIDTLFGSNLTSDGSFIRSKAVELFADPNSDVIVRAVGNLGTDLAAWEVTITGRLEPVQD